MIDDDDPNPRVGSGGGAASATPPAKAATREAAMEARTSTSSHEWWHADLRSVCACECREEERSARGDGAPPAAKTATEARDRRRSSAS